MLARPSSRPAVFGSGIPRGVGWLVLFACLAAAPISRADIQEPVGAHAKGARQQRREQPANGVPQEKSIDQGATVEIILRSHGRIGKWVDFTIRSQPEHGSLTGPPRQLTRDSAAVTYVHSADDGPGVDTFTYSVQAAGSAVSAPVPVTIKIRDTAPEIVATPAELDFGAVKVGDTSGAELVLQNTGGGEAVGRLEVPPPWIVDGSAEYRLAHGQRQTFRIVFGPRSGRSYSETIPVVTQIGAPTHLLGTGLGAPGEADALAAAAVGTLGANSVSAGSGPGSTAGGAEMPGAVAAVPGRPVASVAKPPQPAASRPGVSTDPLQGLPDPADDAAAGAAQADSMLDNTGFITSYDAGIKQIKLRSAGRTTLDISWKPLTPAPKSYRIEMRHLAADADGKLRVDWRPYAQVDMHSGKDLYTATLRGLPPQKQQTLRVVAFDALGQVAGGSATLQATTLPGSGFWEVTPLRVLLAMLLFCGALAVRRRWEERQILREIDESRAASPDYLYRS